MATKHAPAGFHEEDDMERGRKFRLNRREGKWLGVCAGIADFTGVDAVLVRVALILLTLAAFPWPLLAYGAVYWAAKPKKRAGRDRDDVFAEPGMLRGDPGPQREIDRRIAEVDSFVAHSNSRLAREFEELR
jgi:phage shock protein C